ncbi:hypothetical protein [Leptospira noguchii]|uniref:hypothetical protein n=1 Tax=Leptospira noguchii TaxID=28182 RepID=UPI001FB65B01|nr:hypothetical protein [Leptospira noguchii]UOG40323.1 hypothetical protein MAL05_10435 [Leptospira noguchii]
MRTEKISKKQKIEILISFKLYLLRLRLVKLFGKYSRPFPFNEDYRMPKSCNLILNKIIYYEIYLISDIEKLAKAISNICEKYSFYSHSRKEEIREKIKDYYNIGNGSKWTLIDQFPCKDSRIISFAKISILSKYDSLLILETSFRLHEDVTNELNLLSKSKIHYSFTYNRPRLKYLFRIIQRRLLFGCSSVSKSDVLNDNLRIYIENINLYINRKFLKYIPSGILYRINNQRLKCFCLGLQASKEVIDKTNNEYFKKSIPFNAANGLDFYDEYKTKLLSIPNFKWNSISKSTYFLTVRMDKDETIPDYYMNSEALMLSRIDSWRELPHIIILNYTISLFSNMLANSRSHIFKLRSSGFLSKIFLYYKFKNRFMEKFKYFDVILKEIFSKHTVEFKSAKLNNYYGTSLIEYNERIKEQYFSKFDFQFKEIKEDLQVTIHETTQTILLLLTITGLLVSVIELFDILY